MELGGRWPRARRSADQILEMYVGRGRAPVDNNYHFFSHSRAAGIAFLWVFVGFVFKQR